ncbi:DNA helicase [Tanacetum coccineum]
MTFGAFLGHPTLDNDAQCEYPIHDNDAHCEHHIHDNDAPCEHPKQCNDSPCEHPKHDNDAPCEHPKHDNDAPRNMVNRVVFVGVCFATFFATAPLCDNCSQLECYWPLSTNAGFARQESRQEFKNFLRKKKVRRAHFFPFIGVGIFAVMKIGPSSSSNQARRKHFSVSQTTSGESSLHGAPSLYLDLGDCDQACEYFHAEFWLPFVRDPPKIIKELFKDRHFMESICAYNMTFAMTSFGANVGDSVNNGLGPYVFMVEGYLEQPKTCVDKELLEFKIRWSLELKLVNNGSGGDKQLTMNMFYSFQLHDRFNLYALLPRGGRLFQQYLVNAYISIKQNRLDYIQSKQDMFRSEYLQGVHDTLFMGDSDGHDAGKRIILLASFTGGPRYMYKHYQDALAICRVNSHSTKVSRRTTFCSSHVSRFP